MESTWTAQICMKFSSALQRDIASKRSNQVNPYRAERLAFRSNRYRCRQKKAYTNEAGAQARIAYLRTCGTGIDVERLAAYQCRFDPTHWHVGHKPHYIAYLEQVPDREKTQPPSGLANPSCGVSGVAQQMGNTG